MPRRLVIGAIVFAFLWLVTPPFVPTCPFRWLTGLPCPLCGITRALFALAKGDWRQAVSLHALSPLIALSAIAVVIAGQRAMARAWPWLALCVFVYGLARVVRLTHTL